MLRSEDRSRLAGTWMMEIAGRSDRSELALSRERALFPSDYSSGH